MSETPTDSMHAPYDLAVLRGVVALAAVETAGSAVVVADSAEDVAPVRFRVDFPVARVVDFARLRAFSARRTRGKRCSRFDVQ